MLLPENLHQAWLDLLARRHSRLCVAESLTCGNLQRAIGEVPGISKHFVGGLTAYAIPEKTRLLGVDAAHATACNAVSARVAEEMAAGALKLFHAEIALSTTGYAEPDDAHGIALPTAFVCCAVAGPERNAPTITRVWQWTATAPLSRVAAQEEVARFALSQGFAFLDAALKA